MQRKAGRYIREYREYAHSHKPGVTWELRHYIVSEGTAWNFGNVIPYSEAVPRPIQKYQTGEQQRMGDMRKRLKMGAIDARQTRAPTPLRVPEWNQGRMSGKNKRRQGQVIPGISCEMLPAKVQIGTVKNPQLALPSPAATERELDSLFTGLQSQGRKVKITK